MSLSKAVLPDASEPTKEADSVPATSHKERQVPEEIANAFCKALALCIADSILHEEGIDTEGE